MRNSEQSSCLILQTQRDCAESFRQSESDFIFKMNRNVWNNNRIYMKTRDEWVVKDHIRDLLIMNKETDSQLRTQRVLKNMIVSEELM